MTPDEQAIELAILQAVVMRQLYEPRVVDIRGQKVMLAFQKAGKRPRIHIGAGTNGSSRSGWALDAL